MKKMESKTKNEESTTPGRGKRKEGRILKGDEEKGKN